MENLTSESLRNGKHSSTIETQFFCNKQGILVPKQTNARSPTTLRIRLPSSWLVFSSSGWSLIKLPTSFLTLNILIPQCHPHLARFRAFLPSPRSYWISTLRLHSKQIDKGLWADR